MAGFFAYFCGMSEWWNYLSLLLIISCLSPLRNPTVQALSNKSRARRTCQSGTNVSLSPRFRNQYRQTHSFGRQLIVMESNRAKWQKPCREPGTDTTHRASFRQDQKLAGIVSLSTITRLYLESMESVVHLLSGKLFYGSRQRFLSCYERGYWII